MAGRRSYHHGDLRRALIDGAVELVREQGLRGWTLRGVARRVGVSHAAPYHHFRDVEDLLGAVTALGFDTLRAELVAAMDSAPRTARARLRAMAQAYVAFGAANPGLYQVMFRRIRGESEGSDAGRAAGHATLGVLVEEVARGQAAGIIPAESSPMEQVLPAWATLHGFISLSVLGPLESMGILARPFEELVDEVAAAAVHALMR